MKKIIITENQAKYVVGSLISEVGGGDEEKGSGPKKTVIKNPDGSTTTITTDSTKQIIPFNFKAGFWSSEKTDLPQQVDTKLSVIQEFLKSHQSSKITITIQAGESAITNYDNENIDSKTKKGTFVQPGYLAQHRADSLTKTLTSAFQKLVSSKVITEMPTFTQPDIKIGVEKVAGPKASAEQFVRAVIYAESKDVVDEKCLINLQFIIKYDATWQTKSPDGHNRGHNCDRALFYLYANDVPIMNVDRRDYIVDLNNALCDGCSKYNRLVVGKEDAKKILEGHEDIKIKILCNSNVQKTPGIGVGGCHSDALNVTIINGDNQTLLPSTFITTGDELAYREGRTIMLLDNCGKPLNIQLAGEATKISAKDAPKDPVAPKQPPKKVSKEPKKELVGVYKKNLFGKETGEFIEYSDASLAEIFKYVDSDGIVRYPREATDMSPLYSFNNKPWTFVQYKTFGANVGMKPEKWKPEEKEVINAKQKKVYDYLVSHPELMEKAKKQKDEQRAADTQWYSQYGLEKEVK
jgi:hypothetical protein